MIGAKNLFNRLLHHNVKYVFGYPGGAILPVLNEFYNQKKIKYILTRTEAGGSFMAEGYSKVTKTPGVVMVTSGPGAINVMTSLQNALSDGTSLLALTGQVSTSVLGTDAFQEADVVGISTPCTKWNHMIKDGTEINNVVDKAFQKMLNKRHGPVLIDLPKNVMSNVHEQNVSNVLPENDEQLKPTIGIYEMIHIIKNAKRPVVLAGQGIFQSDAVDDLRIFVKTYNLPVTTTLMGLGIYDEEEELSLKMVGMHGSYYANMAIQNSDLIINFGSRFDDRIIGNPTKFAPNAKIIHIDILSKNINRTIKSHYYINDDCKKILQKINRVNYGLYHPYAYQEWHFQINKWKRIPFQYPNKNGVLQGRHVISELNKIIKKDIHNYRKKNKNNYTIVADVGAHQMWAAQFFDYNYPRVKFITSGGLGSMGFAVPSSMGVKVGLPDDIVICICGDGGFSMSFNEIITAIENKINIKVFIINNSYQLMVKMWQEKFYNNQIVGTKMFNPPFELMCKSMGCESFKIDVNSSLQSDLNYVLNYEKGPIVVNVITDENESVLPMVSPGKALDDMIIYEDGKETYTGDAPC